MKLGFELGASLEDCAAEEGYDGAVGGECAGDVAAYCAGGAYDDGVFAGEEEGRHG